MSFKKIIVASAFAVVASAGASFSDDGKEGISIRDDIRNFNTDQGVMLEGRSSTTGSPEVYVEESPGAYSQETPVEEASDFGVSESINE